MTYISFERSKIGATQWFLLENRSLALYFIWKYSLVLLYVFYKLNIVACTVSWSDPHERGIAEAQLGRNLARARQVSAMPIATQSRNSCTSGKEFATCIESKGKLIIGAMPLARASPVELNQVFRRNWRELIPGSPWVSRSNYFKWK